ncbi:hypothetical protein DCAR_0314298 [Daucus carota subsp. sativus]|uniref:Ubiquitin-like protease family profile domain-containing protein n=1 Tax=Daucus carota subsp. sativus TaxID=79200 RepID=A0A169WGF8_DAUCS|nr:PREDICTED: NEDD8-specific protease 1-like [Daucus carota subsp. sativus]WOG94996.1 hypothetical protein DCAR_0314298 [Daucus carota subsp. sativus]
MGDDEKIVLGVSDLDTLGEGRYLNDQIIAFYFNYLFSNLDDESKPVTRLVSPSMSLLIANCRDDEGVKEFVESMSSKRVVVFVVNDNEDFSAGDGGNHWSTLVYDRTKNMFLHFDSQGFSMEGVGREGVNNFYALKLYDAVKEHVGPGGEVARLQTSSSLKKQRNKKKSVMSLTGAGAGLPVFKECETPEQTNNYDCGLYVLAIAKEICRWCSRGHNKSDIVSTIKKNVDSSVEQRMREEVLKIVEGKLVDS